MENITATIERLQRTAMTSAQITMPTLAEFARWSQGRIVATAIERPKFAPYGNEVVDDNAPSRSAACGPPG
ncbi:hypothetical protein [Allobranchiibius sp. CTAmp26]|uniref:hypothetical protein n=1 Tax=Allobranchiibius sp. CTAmp26 TaxID=2815214 RepID=UPI001AA0D20C|nr:hypothetical protein [Allobranchiibius sp. CTAmp26]MBO1755741.1 hypothetical protein [Allobranchiibius sp. CTAmp26]